MAKERVMCRACNREIKKAGDLIVSWYFVFVRPYHASCYAKNLLSLRTVFMKNYPINGISGTIGAIFAAVIGIVFFFLALFSGSIANLAFYLIFAVIVFITPVVRLYSYYKYEKPLKR